MTRIHCLGTQTSFSVYKKQRNHTAHCAQIAKSEYQVFIAKISRTQTKILFAYVQHNNRLSHSIIALQASTVKTVLDTISLCEFLSDTFGKMFKQDDGRPALPFPNSKFQMESLEVTHEVVYLFPMNLALHTKAEPDY